MGWALPESDTYFAPILQHTPEGFQIDHLREALKYCQNFGTAVDGGAHVGTWSVHMSNMFRDVLSFEPAPDTFRCLLKNTEGYGNVSCHQVALGADNGRCIVAEDETRLGNSGSRVVRCIHDSRRNKRKFPNSVPRVTLDSQELNMLDFLKLDVEGSEYPALLGAEETVMRCRPVIVVELKKFTPPRHGGSVRVVELLESWGYHLVGGLRNDKVFVSK